MEFKQMKKAYSLKKLYQVILITFLAFISINISAEEDKRTPFEKYQGAYTGAYMLCVLQQKMAFIVENARLRGTPLDAGFKNKTDLPTCQKTGLREMKKEYNNILPLITNNEGKEAIKEHYVHAIMHIKKIEPYTKESEAVYTKRMNKTFRDSEELYVRFEITQP
jgi:predicted patatin/cPLA2 family phospholipase